MVQIPSAEEQTLLFRLVDGFRARGVLAFRFGEVEVSFGDGPVFPSDADPVPQEAGSVEVIEAAEQTALDALFPRRP